MSIIRYIPGVLSMLYTHNIATNTQKHKYSFAVRNPFIATMSNNL